MFTMVMGHEITSAASATQGRCRDGSDKESVVLFDDAY